MSAGTVANGTTARIHCTTLGGASVTGIDITAVTTKSFIAVDAPGVPNESSVTRCWFWKCNRYSYGECIPMGLKEYITAGGNWTFSQIPTSCVR